MTSKTALLDILDNIESMTNYEEEILKERPLQREFALGFLAGLSLVRQNIKEYMAYNGMVAKEESAND